MSSLFEADRIVVYVSGGKDSTACLLKALEHYPKEKVTPVFNDTGWEHPVTYEYLDYLQEALGIKIERTRGETIPDLILKYKKFPFSMGRFCTSTLKSQAIYKWYKSKGYYTKGYAESWIGIRSNESTNRKVKYGALDPNDLHEYRDLYTSCPKSLNAHVKVRLPILDWTEEQVFEYLESKGIKKNPLYDEGTNDRVGCYPCLLAGKKVQQRMFETPIGQQRLQVIRQLEGAIGQKYEMYDTDQGSCEVCKI